MTTPSDPPSLNKDVPVISPAKAETGSGTSSSEGYEAIGERHEFFIGPLPHPDHIRQYNEICPGIAQQIFDRQGKEQQQRHDIERMQVQAVIDDRKSARRERRQGQLFGFTIAMTGIIGGAVVSIVSICHNNTAVGISGGVISAGSLVTLVGLFLAGRNAGEKDQDAPQQPDMHDGNESSAGDHVNSKSEQLQIRKAPRQSNA